MAHPSRDPDSNAPLILPAVASAIAPTYLEGMAVPLSVDLDGTLRSTAGAGGGAGDASEAQQELQTALLTTIDGDTGSIKTATESLATAVDTGAIHVIIDSGAGSGGTAADDDADFVDGTTPGTPAMGVYESTPSTVTDGDLGIVGITNDRRLKTSSVIESSALPSGAATSAKQDTIIGHLDGVEGVLATIDADTGSILLAAGATGDAAATAGSTGSLSAKQRLMTSQLDSIKTAVETLDNAISGSEMQVDIVGALPAGTNAIGKLAANSGVDIGDVDVTSLVPGTTATSLGKAEDAAHTSGDTGVMALAVRAASPTERSAGPTDGDYVPIGVNEVGAQWVTPTPSANGGLSIFRSLDLDETEEEVKASAGTVYGAWVTNTTSATIWLKFYNATAANVTVGSTTPVITIGIPGNATDDISANFGPGGMGIGFGTAITVAATTGVADADTGAPSANALIINLFYK